MHPVIIADGYHPVGERRFPPRGGGCGSSGL